MNTHIYECIQRKNQSILYMCIYIYVRICTTWTSMSFFMCQRIEVVWITQSEWIIRNGFILRIRLTGEKYICLDTMCVFLDTMCVLNRLRCSKTVTWSMDHLVIRKFVCRPPRYHLAIKGVCEQFVVLGQSSGPLDSNPDSVSCARLITILQKAALGQVLQILSQDVSSLSPLRLSVHNVSTYPVVSSRLTAAWVLTNLLIQSFVA